MPTKALLVDVAPHLGRSHQRDKHGEDKDDRWTARQGKHTWPNCLFAQRVYVTSLALSVEAYTASICQHFLSSQIPMLLIWIAAFFSAPVIRALHIVNMQSL